MQSNILLLVGFFISGCWLAHVPSLHPLEIEELAKWGFEYFELYQNFHSNKGTAPLKISQFHTIGDYHLIRKVVIEEGAGLTSYQIVRTLHLFDRFLANAKGRQKIVRLFCNLLARQQVVISPEILDTGIWNDVLEYLATNYSVQMNSMGIGIDGKDSKGFLKSNIFIFLNLSPFYDGIHLKNLVLDCEETELIQRTLWGQLKSVYLENCLFANSLNFKNCSNLTSFDCINSSNVEEMLEGIVSLVSLSISDCEIDSRITQFISQNGRLENVCFSNNQFCSKVSFSFVFDLAKLESLDLSHCKLTDFFVVLDQIDFQHPWSTLNLAGAEMSRNDFEILCRNFSNLPWLTKLNISDNLLCVASLARNIGKLKSLQELNIGNCDKDLSELLDRLIELNMQVTIVSSNFQYPTEVEHLCYLTNVALNDLEEDVISNNFFNVRALKLDLFQFYSDDLLSKFNALSALEVLVNEENLDVFRLLMNENSIESLSLIICENDFEFPSEIFQNSALKKLKISGDLTAQDRLFTKLSKETFWLTLEEFDCSEIAPKEIPDILRAVKMPSLKSISFTIQDCYPQFGINPVNGSVFKLFDLYACEMERLFTLLLHFPALTHIKIEIKHGNCESTVDLSDVIPTVEGKDDLPTKIEKYIHAFPSLTTLLFGMEEYKVVGTSNSRKLIRIQ